MSLLRVRAANLLRSVGRIGGTEHLKLHTVVDAVKVKKDPPLRASARHWSLPQIIATQMRTDVLVKPAFRGRIAFTYKVGMPQHENIDISRSGENVDGRLKSMSNIELVQFVSDMVKSPNTQSELLPAIEAVCCARAKSFDNVQLLLIADAFLVMKYNASTYISHVFAEFNQRWDDIAAISKEDIIMVSYCICVARKSPLSLMQRIEAYVGSNAEHFSGNELGLICHAFFATNTAFRNFTTCERVSEITLRDLSTKCLKFYMLGNILKALRHAHFTKFAFYDQLAQHIMALKGSRGVKFSLNDLTNLAFTYSSIKMGNSELFSFISQEVVKLIDKPTARPRTKDLARLLWSFSSLLEPLDSAVCDKLVDELVTNPRLALSYPQVFIEACISLVMSEIYQPALLQQLFSKPFVKHVLTQWVDQDFQLQLLESAVKIEYNEFSLPKNVWGLKPVGNLKLDLCIRQGLMSMMTALHTLTDPACVLCHYLLPHSRITDIEMRLDENGHLRPFNSQFRANLDTLQSINPSDIRVNITGLNSTESRQMSVMEELLQQVEEQTVTRPDPGFLHLLPLDKPVGTERRILIKMMGWNQYQLNRPQLIGLHVMELRLLRRLGYEILVFSPPQAQKLDRLSVEERLKFVRDILTKELAVKLT